METKIPPVKSIQRIGQKEGLPMIFVFYSEEDQRAIADIPGLKHRFAFGSSPEKALREVVMAKNAWLEAAHEHGKPIPGPHYRPVIYQVA
jgi:predicted RNase H-like HicB family nuclease